MAGVRDPARRQEKYTGKIDGTIIGARFTALKTSMTEQTGVQFPIYATMENSIKTTILEPAGVASVLIPAYLNYARELQSRSTRFSGATLTNEAQILKDKWEARGLVSATLISIAANFSITVT